MLGGKKGGPGKKKRVFLPGEKTAKKSSPGRGQDFQGSPRVQKKSPSKKKLQKEKRVFDKPPEGPFLKEESAKEKKKRGS